MLSSRRVDESIAGVIFYVKLGLFLVVEKTMMVIAKSEREAVDHHFAKTHLFLFDNHTDCSFLLKCLGFLKQNLVENTYVSQSFQNENLIFEKETKKRTKTSSDCSRFEKFAEFHSTQSGTPKIITFH